MKYHPIQMVEDLIDNFDNSISEDGETSLVAAGYEWVCVCGALNTIHEIVLEVICGCGLTFKVDIGDINDAF